MLINIYIINISRVHHSVGDMMQEEKILEWVLELHESTPDVIEMVDRKTLQVLINDVEHLAVFFCKQYHKFISYNVYFLANNKYLLYMLTSCR